MDFPHEFSTQARARIEAGRLKASRELADAQAHKPPDAWKSGARELDPLYRFHQWQANLRVLEVMDRTLRAASHPFVERLVGTLRRECLDRTLFWTTADLEAREFQKYFNEHRTARG